MYDALLHGKVFSHCFTPLKASKLTSLVPPIRSTTRRSAARSSPELPGQALIHCTVLGSLMPASSLAKFRAAPIHLWLNSSTRSPAGFLNTCHTPFFLISRT